VDKYAAKGAKKLFSLSRTKIRLAKEAETIETRPVPLPIVRLFSGVELRTVEECEAHTGRLKEEVDYDDDGSVATTVVQLCDIIEGVKYRFEPPEYMPLMGEEDLALLEKECAASGLPLAILIMSDDVRGPSVFFGEEPPAGARHYSRVISGIAPLLRYLYESKHFSEGKRLRNVTVQYAGKTLLANAAAASIILLASHTPK